MGKIININGAPASETKQIVTPTGEPTSTLPNIQFEPFDAQGYVTKFTEQPTGQFPIFTKDGHVVAVCNRPDMAGIICESLRLMALARAAQLAEVAQKIADAPESDGMS